MPAIDPAILYQRIRGFEPVEGGGVLTATFDLEPGGAGVPSASTILKDALRDAVQLAPAGLAGRFDEDAARTRIEAAIEEATAAGATGLAVYWPLDRDEPDVASSPTAYRNRVDLAPRPWLFEVERHQAITRPVVVVAHLDRAGADFVILHGDRPATIEHLEGDDHALRDSTGRTAVHGRGGAVGDPSGGHGKTSIESSAEEHREIWARQIAEALEDVAGDADALLLAGNEELHARVIDKLPGALSPRVERVDGVESTADARTLEGIAATHRRRHQFDDAAATLQQAAAGRGALSTLDDIERAAIEGRVDTLVLADDAVRHYGDALDAREHPARAGDEQRIDALLRSCLERGATARFVTGEVAATLQAGAAGTLRW